MNVQKSADKSKRKLQKKTTFVLVFMRNAVFLITAFALGAILFGSPVVSKVSTSVWSSIQDLDSDIRSHVFGGDGE